MSRIGSCVAGLVALGVMLGCGDESDPVPTTEPLSFAEDIHPILRLKCAGSDCHGVDNIIQPGHAAPIASDAYAATQRTSMGVPVYQRIVARTSGTDPLGFMPPTSFGPMPCQGALGAPGCLTVAEHDLIEEWVAQGAPP